MTNYERIVMAFKKNNCLKKVLNTKSEVLNSGIN